MSLPPIVGLVTLGVDDVPRAAAFYRRLGWPVAAEESPDFCVFRTGGATITKPAESTEWGGYSGYFTDPDGHAWEVAHNPFWPLSADGLPQLPSSPR